MWKWMLFWDSHHSTNHSLVFYLYCHSFAVHVYNKVVVYVYNKVI